MKKYGDDKNILQEMIYLGSDHAGFKLKEEIKKILTRNNYSHKDLGNKKYAQGDDYPEYSRNVALKVSQSGNRGILVCDSGVGVCIAANKINKVRAVNACSKKMAVMSRKHNDSNILCLGQDYLGPGQAEEIIMAWLEEGFSSEERHHRRVNMISSMENGK